MNITTSSDVQSSTMKVLPESDITATLQTVRPSSLFQPVEHATAEQTGRPFQDPDQSGSHPPQATSPLDHVASPPLRPAEPESLVPGPVESVPMPKPAESNRANTSMEVSYAVPTRSRFEVLVEKRKFEISEENLVAAGSSSAGPVTVPARKYPTKKKKFELSEEDLAAAGSSYPAPTNKLRQTGSGALDTWVERAVAAKETIPNNQTTPLHLPENFHIISDQSYSIKKFKLTTRRLEVRSHGDVEEFINGLLQHLLQQVDPDERVAMSVSSEEFPKEVCHVSFRRARFMTFEVVFKAIKAMIQSGSLNEHFLDNPVRIAFHRCEGIRGLVRKRKGVQDLDIYTKCARSIIRIQNDDNICLARALVVAISKKKLEGDPTNQAQKKYNDLIRQSTRPLQKTEALDLLQKAGVTEQECSTALDKLQVVVPYQINVVEYEERLPTCVYQGASINPDGSPREKIYLLYSNDHFDVITKMAPLFGQSNFCHMCFKAFDHKEYHRCEMACKSCYAIPACISRRPRKCSTCNRTFNNEDCFNNHLKVNSGGKSICSTKFICMVCRKFVNLTDRKSYHVCGEIYCGVCDKHVVGQHQCHIKPKKLKPVNNANITVYIFYDLETVQIKVHEKGGLEHQPYLLVSQAACNDCIGNDVVVRCQACGMRENVFQSSSCVANFMHYVCNSFRSFNRVICIGHNAKAYDGQWVLKYMLEKKWSPEVVETGSKLMRIVYENLTFLDSINYIPLPLSKFTSAFGLTPQSVKGHFPHFVFNVVNHPFDVMKPRETNYTSTSLPPVEAYDPDGMSTSDRKKFLEWYEANKSHAFNFLEDAILYCKMDVTLLRQGCTVYRRLYLEKSATDPFKEASTIAGTCMVIFKKHFLKWDQIGIVPAGGYRLHDKQSAVAAKWLGWVEHQLGRQLDSAINGREKVVCGYKVDGYDEFTKTCWEFAGCYWHGHTCIRGRTKPYYNDPTVTAQTLYEQTLEKNSKLRAGGFTVVEKWECEWAQEVSGSQEIQDFLRDYNLPEKFTILDPRDAFFGGQTEAIQLHRKCQPGEKILYQDFTSLYPWVNKNGIYPIGHPTIYLGKNCLPLDRAVGLLRCKVLPPRGLYLPVLPTRIDGKLFFPLCYTCASERKDFQCTHSQEARAITGTWATCELQKAVSLGYVILATYELWHYTKTAKIDPATGQGGLFTGYVNMWLKLKQEASGWPSPEMTVEQKRAYIQDYKTNEGIDLDYDKIEVNPGLRQIAKLNLNSLWGKFGQRPDLSHTEIISEADKWFGLLYDPSVEVKSVLPVNEDVIIAKWSHAEEVAVIQRSQNVVIAAFTTAV